MDSVVRVRSLIISRELLLESFVVESNDDEDEELANDDSGHAYPPTVAQSFVLPVRVAQIASRV